ncbi:MAG: DUF4355 domain-containing protein [Peptococcaceae bacterium]|nr:DUF4355 domain-containing protein [Peptococcaceae bacterium]MBQ2994245.1 DUF4355 domain-containing protein [Peptococcaceae bacterium]
MAEPILEPGTDPTPIVEPKTYTEEEVAGLRSQWEEEVQKRLADAKQEGMSEAERLAKLTAEEKLQEEMKKLQEENETLKKNDARTKLEAETLKTLEQEGLPSNFAALVMADDAETVKKNISALKTSYDAAVQAGVEGRLKGKSPAAGGGGGLTKEEEMQSEIRKIIEGSR